MGVLCITEESRRGNSENIVSVIKGETYTWEKILGKLIMIKLICRQK